MDYLEFSAIKNKLIRTGSLEIQIVSDSMRPFIQIGEQLTIRPLPKRLDYLDLVVFLDRDRLICHFLWLDQKKFNDTIVTRSLKEITLNETPTSYSHILGIVENKKVPLFLKIKITFLSFLKL